MDSGARGVGVGVMKWMRERDLLIAQTMAFVQSVTGRKPDVDGPYPLADHAAVTPTRLPDIEAMLAEALEISVPPKPAAQVAPIAETPISEAPVRQPPVLQPSLLQPPAVPPALPPSIASAQPSVRSAYQNEIQARVAHFRAHQQRFRQEREDYCAATMAKVQATLERFPAPPRINK